MTKQSEYLYDRLRQTQREHEAVLKKIHEDWMREENRKLEQEILEMHSDRSKVLVAKIILAMLCFSGGFCAGVWYVVWYVSN
jgi:hypothetical protein